MFHWKVIHLPPPTRLQILIGFAAQMEPAQLESNGASILRAFSLNPGETSDRRLLGRDILPRQFSNEALLMSPRLFVHEGFTWDLQNACY